MLHEIIDFFNSSSWIYHVFFIIFAALLLDLIWRKSLTVIKTRVEKTRNRWDDAFFSAVRIPASGLIWLYGVSYGLELMPSIEVDGFLPYVMRGRSILTVALIAWFLIRFIQGVEHHVLHDGKSSKFDQTSLHAISRLLRISVLITAGLIVLDTMGYNLQGVLAFGGIGGIAVGFASKDLLANFFGGLMIFLDRPFALGDWIRSPDRNIEGTVENIGWRLTRIRTFDQRPLYVPNSVFTSIVVENPSRMFNRRIYETIGVRYDDASMLSTIVDDVHAMLRQHEDIDQNKIIMVNFDRFGDSALEFFIYAFTKTTIWADYHKVKQDVLLKILHIIEGHHASVAYPTQRLLLESIPDLNKQHL